jgi:hypothetical protein
MATTTGTLVFYDSWMQKLAEAVNLSSDSFIVGLTTSSYTPDASTHDEVADITNEVSGNGYARQTLGSVTFSQSGGTATFDAADPVFTASGGSIVARYYFIFDDDVTGDPLVCYGLLDNTPADVTTTDGNTLTLNLDASGLFTIS